MDRSVKLPTPDYEAEDVLVVSEPGQLRALGDDRRMKLVLLLRERAASTTELAGELGLPKGTVGHHLKVLERAGLIRVVRTRQVRAVTEKYYGRVARLFVIKSADGKPGDDAVALLHASLRPRDLRRFVRRLEQVTAEFASAEGGVDELTVELTVHRREDGLA